MLELGVIKRRCCTICIKNDQTVVKSFLKCGISNFLDGSEDYFLYEDDDEQEDEDNDERDDSDDSNLGFAGLWKVSLLYKIMIPIS